MKTIFNPEDLGITSLDKLTISEQNNINSFEPIGIGNPLIIRFHTLYAGNLPKKNQDILISSLIKDDITYKAPPKGIHQIYTDINDKQTLYPSAANEGTELIYYTKAFDNSRLNLSIEVMVDKFNQNKIAQFTQILNQAAGLPIFVPYASFILLGSKLINIGSDIINKIIDNKPFLSYNINISDNIGGIQDTQSGWLIGVNEQQASAFNGYSIVPDEYSKGNVHLAKNGVKYTGEVPYIILSIDGRNNPRYENFKASIANATILKEFYGISENTQLENIQNMISLYNDYSYIEKIKRAKESIERTNNAAEIDRLNKLIAAYKKNIANEDLQKIFK